jgi:hypothetical protein
MMFYALICPTHPEEDRAPNFRKFLQAGHEEHRYMCAKFQAALETKATPY